MQIDKLYYYKMTPEEIKIWNSLYQKIIDDFTKLSCYKSNQRLIDDYMLVSKYYAHSAGYNHDMGYYYIENGDRGTLYLMMNNKNSADAEIFIVHKLLWKIGQKQELHKRNDLQNWWKCHTKYDSRKYIFEYIISGIAALFGEKTALTYADDYTKSMNYWFEDDHWKFDFKTLRFVEISNSEEQDELPLKHSKH